MSNLLVNLNNIQYKVAQKTLLYDVSMAVHKEDFITIIGPNGAGKTTLLNIIMNKLKVASGDVFRKKDLKIGYMPQSFVVNKMMPMTIENFLQLNNRIIYKDLDQTLEIVSLLDKKKQSLEYLSGGEIQRLLLARAILKKPDLLILDEPAQNLDMSGQLMFYRLIETLRKTYQCAILMVSHDLHMVMTSTTQVICLFQHICCQGSPQFIQKDPKFIEIFGQDYSKLIGFYQHHHDHDHQHSECEESK